MLSSSLWLAAIIFLVAESKPSVPFNYESNLEVVCTLDKRGQIFGWCPVKGGVCCKDLIHCCPAGFVCDVAGSRCFLEVSNSINNNSNNQAATLLLNIITDNNEDIEEQMVKLTVPVQGDSPSLKRGTVSLENKSNTTIEVLEINNTPIEKNNIVIEVLKNNSTSTEKNNNIIEVDNNDDLEEDMSSFTVPCQGLSPVLVGGILAGVMAVALGMYLGCKNKHAALAGGYQQI